jgi:DMSO/TMAO reductase YedYZ molybdopterin-dependent catalytic subunit
MAALRIEGAIAHELALDHAALAALPDQIADVGTLVSGRAGGGVRVASILDLADPDPAASTVTLLSADASFVAQAPLAAVRTGIVIYRLGDGPLPDDLGGPLRFLLIDAAICAPDGKPSACSNVKQLAAIRVEPPRA